MLPGGPKYRGGVKGALGKFQSCEYDSIESPIHIFEECVAMVSTHQGLFNDPFPTQLVGRLSLYQVAELALVGTVRDLTDIDQNYSNVSSTE